MFQQIGSKAYKPGLETTHRLDEHFGHPHQQFKTIHIAGTNGKGSCSHTIAAVLQSAGYRVGLFTSPHLVDFRERIRINGENGVYGTTRTPFTGQTMEVAFAQEVETGSAEIWSTVSGGAPRAYRVQIERISDADAKRNMVLRVTDPALLAQTGGIVQGMSGSPIVQNGRLVGAVTHVLVNDPTRGYGIFAQTMLEQAEIVAQRAQEPELAK